MSNPYITGITDSVDTSMELELGVANFLQPYFHTENSQTGRTNKMKGMMKSVSDNLGRYEHIQHEMTRLSHEIILKMNEMNLFYIRNPYSETNKKAHLETEVINLYNVNKKRIESVGIKKSNLQEFMKNSDRNELSIQKRIDDSKTQPPHRNDYRNVYDPRNRHAEPRIMHEKENSTSRDHPHQTTSHSDKRVGGNREGVISVTQKDAVKKRNDDNSPDISDDDESEYEEEDYNGYLRGRPSDMSSRYEYKI